MEIYIIKIIFVIKKKKIHKVIRIYFLYMFIHHYKFFFCISYKFYTCVILLFLKYMPDNCFSWLN